MKRITISIMILTAILFGVIANAIKLKNEAEQVIRRIDRCELEIEFDRWELLQQELNQTQDLWDHNRLYHSFVVDASELDELTLQFAAVQNAVQQRAVDQSKRELALLRTQIEFATNFEQISIETIF